MVTLLDNYLVNGPFLTITLNSSVDHRNDRRRGQIVVRRALDICLSALSLPCYGMEVRVNVPCVMRCVDTNRTANRYSGRGGGGERLDHLRVGTAFC